MFITAEIGINHNGDINIAKRLIDMAVSCGCDAVKFQKRTIELVYTEEFLNSLRQSPWGTTQREQKMGLEFGKEEYDEIDRYCKGKIDWFASAWDIESLKFLQQYDLKYNKIASKMLSNMDFVVAVAKENKDTFISNGLNIDISWLPNVFQRFTVMHCVMKYPCPIEECNLSKISELRKLYQSVGYSSHHASTLDVVIAASLGAKAIEKHITLDRTFYGTDQSSSLEESGLRLVVRNCRAVEKAL